MYAGACRSVKVEDKTPEYWTNQIKTRERIGIYSTVFMGLVAITTLIICQSQYHSLENELEKCKKEINNCTAPRVLSNFNENTDSLAVIKVNRVPWQIADTRIKGIPIPF